MTRSVVGILLCVAMLQSCAREDESNSARETDTTAPSIVRFELASPSQTTRREVRFDLQAADDQGIDGFSVGLASAPAADSDQWLPDPPESFTLPAVTRTETRRLSAWVRDSSGNISEPQSIEVTQVPPGDEIWSKHESEGPVSQVYAVATGGSGGVFAVGSVATDSTGLDWRIERYAPDGTEYPEWSRTFDGAGADDRAASVAVQMSGPVEAGGEREVAAVYVAGTRGGWSVDGWIKKFSGDGSEVPAGASWDAAGWDKVIGGRDLAPERAPESGSERIHSILVDGSGNVLVAGAGEDLVSSSSGLDWWITTFLGDGRQNSDWVGRFYDTAGGDDEALVVASVEATTSGGPRGFLFGGYVTADTAAGGQAMRLRKFPSYQAEITEPPWPIATGPGDEAALRVTAVTAATDGTVYAGITTMSGWQIRAYRDGEAAPLWRIDGDGPGEAVIHALASDQWGHIYAAGTERASSGDSVGWIRKFDATGREIVDGWNKRLPANSSIQDIETAPGGRVVAVGAIRDRWWVATFFDDREER